MNGETKEIVAAIHELDKKVVALKEKNENLEAYIFKELKADIEKLCSKVEECMGKSIDERQRDLKWMIAQMTTILVGAIGWIAFLLK